eukprot:1159511-Pelagomonas_calceolata.AAC.5
MRWTYALGNKLAPGQQNTGKHTARHGCQMLSSSTMNRGRASDEAMPGPQSANREAAKHGCRVTSKDVAENGCHKMHKVATGCAQHYSRACAA